MTQEGSDASVASSYLTPNWWDIHANPLPPWTATACWPPTNPGCTTDTPSGEETITISFTNLSNHSGSCIDSSTAKLSGEPGNNHLWSHVLLSAGRGNRDDLASRSTEMFYPACDYLNKLGSSWESLIEHDRVTNLSNQVRNLSITPPYPQNNNHHQIGPCNSISIVPPLDQYSMSMPKEPNTAYMPYVHEFKGDVQHHEIGPSEPYNKFNDGLTDVVSLNPFLNKLPALGFRPLSPSMNVADSSSNNKKQGYRTSPLTSGSGRGSGSTIERKKKGSDDSSNAVLFKKSKRETSSVASLKLQAAKPKMDRISALQKIVSPYGKTNTASVLLAAIEYITTLQEQIQLLSDPYTRSCVNKDLNSWSGLEREEKMESTLDLKSRGLCLVPISYTPQVYQDNNGPDYLTSTYK